MESVSKGGVWPSDWESNRSVSFGQQNGTPLLLFGGTAVSCFTLRPIAEACENLALCGRLHSLAGHNGNLDDYRSLDFRAVVEDGSSVLQEMASNGRKVILGGFSGGALLSVILAARFPDFVSNLFLIGYCPVVRGIGRQCAVALCGLLDCFDFTRGALQKLSFSWKESEVQLKRDPRFRAQPAFRDFSGAAVTLIGRLQTNARRAWKNVRVPAHFFHGALDGRAALRGVQRLVHKVRRSSGAELTIYPGSTHCIASGPEGPRFVSDFRRAIVQSLI